MANTQSIIEAFTEMAARYEQTVDRELRQFWGIGYEQFIAQLIDRMNLAQAGAVLDVATGRGAIPRALSVREGWSGRLIGVDITPEMLRGAHAGLAESGVRGDIDLVCGSGMRLPFCDGVFDTAVCALATHHMRVPDLLGELRRVLRPGGQLLIADVALASLFRTLPGRVLLRTLAWWYGRREGAARLQAEMEAVPNMLTPAQWQTALDMAGFVNLELTTIPAVRAWYPPGILARALSKSLPGDSSNE
jgi:ubiquinone/menaquinone biosynthesis C-methylase UbiE